MHLSVEWLSDAVTLPPGTSTDDVTDALLRIGFEVEGVDTVPPTTGKLVVGTVLSIEELTGLKKPIRFCLVDAGPGNGPDGSDEPRGIICGATNFVEGDTVVVALPGSTLPGGFEIASRKTYGRTSDGRICSTAELTLGTDHSGILVLPPGTAVRKRSSVFLAAAADAAISKGMEEERLRPAGGVAYGEYTMRCGRGAGVGVPMGV